MLECANFGCINYAYVLLSTEDKMIGIFACNKCAEKMLKKTIGLETAVKMKEFNSEKREI